MNPLKKLMGRLMGMPSCEQVNQFLGAYLEETLDEGTRRSFEKHLSRCSLCEAYFEQYATTVQVVRENGSVDVPDELVDHTIAFLKRKRASG